MLKINVTTSRRDGDYSDVFIQYADDDKIHAGAIRKTLTGKWNTIVDGELYTARTKSDAVLTVCYLTGPKFFSGAVYKYGAYTLALPSSE